MSFPSGHALGSLVSYGVLLLVFLPAVPRRWRAPVAAGVGLIVVAVGLTRIALGVHFISDVIAGWLLGVGWLGITAVAFRHWRLETGRPATGLASGLEPEAEPALHAVPEENREHPAHPWRAVAELLVGWVVVLGVLVGAGLLVTVVRPAAGGVSAADRAVVRWFAEHRTSDLAGATELGSWLGNTDWILICTAAACVIALAVQRRWRPVLFVLVVMAGEVTLFLTCSTVVARARPPVTHLGPELPVAASFPSGHVAAAISLYGAVALIVWHATGRWWRWPVVAAAVLLPVYVAASRLYRGVHFPTDVAGSLLLAVPWLAVAWWVLRPTADHGHGTSDGGVEAAVRRRPTP